MRNLEYWRENLEEILGISVSDDDISCIQDADSEDLESLLLELYPNKKITEKIVQQIIGVSEVEYDYCSPSGGYGVIREEKTPLKQKITLKYAYCIWCKRERLIEFERVMPVCSHCEASIKHEAVYTRDEEITVWE